MGKSWVAGVSFLSAWSLAFTAVLVLWWQDVGPWCLAACRGNWM